MICVAPVQSFAAKVAAIQNRSSFYLGTRRFRRQSAIGVPGKFCASEKHKKLAWEELCMGRGKRYQPEQVVNLLRQIEVAVANGKTTAQACKEAEIVEQTYFRWRKEYGGLQVDQARRLRELEQENPKLKRLVAELSLDKLVLKDIVRSAMLVSME
jgi:putative transposase